MELKERAAQILKEYKGDTYAFGLHVMDKVGEFAAQFGKTALLISNTTYLKPVADQVVASLKKHGVELAGERIVRSQMPQEDVYRIESYILHFNLIALVIGGGSSGDAAKTLMSGHAW